MRNYIILIFVFLPLLTLSQNDKKWSKEFLKLETHYKYGRYFQASSGAKKMIRKMEKKGELKEFYLPTQALYYKYEAAIGLRIGNDTLLDQVIEKWDTNLTFLSDSMAMMSNIAIASSAFSFQKYEQATKHYEEADKFVHKNSDPQNYWAQYIRISKMRLYLETMSYNRAISFIDTTIAYQRNLTKRQEKVFNEKKGQEEFIKLKKKEFKKRLSTLGVLMVMKADIYLGQGDLKRADSLYRKNNNDLFSLVKKNDISKLRNSYGYTKLQVMNGDPYAGFDLKKIRKKYAGNVKYSIPNLTYLDIFENEIRADAKLETFNRYNTAVEQFEREIVLNYPKKSAHLFTSEYLGQLEDLTKGKYKSYGKHMSKQALQIDKYYGKDDAGQLPFLYDLATAQINLYDYSGAKTTYENILRIADINNSDSSSFYYNANLELGSFYLNYTTKYEIADSIYQQYFDVFVLRELHPYHPYYGKFLNDYALINVKQDHFKDAIKKYRQLAGITKVKFGEQTEEYGIVLQNMANAQIDMGDYVGAEKNLIAAMVAYKTDKKTKSENYVRNLQAIGELYAINGDFVNSKKNLEQSFSLSKRFETTNEMLPLNMNEGLAELFFDLGKYDKSEEILLSSIKIKEEKLGKNSIELVQPYSLLGEIYLIQGKLIEAEKLITIAVNISKENYGSNALRYLERSLLLGDVYFNMGDYERSLNIYDNVIKTYEEKFGKNYLHISDILISKTKVHLQMNTPVEGLMSDLNRAKDIITTNLSEQHPQIAEVTELKAMVYLREKNYDQALIQLQAANLIYSSTYGDNHYKTADNQVNIALLYYKKGSYENAHSYYKKALGIYGKIFSESHPKYVATLSKIGRTYYAQKKYKKAAETLRQSTKMYLTYINEFFPSLSESEKTLFWASISSDFELFNSLVINYYHEDEKIIGEMYNNRLATKAILLNSSVRLKERIMEFGSQELIQKYKTWLDQKDYLLRAQGMSQDTLDSLEIVIPELRSSINTLEKELSESASGFEQTYETKSVNWVSVKNQLSENEVAMEVIRFNYFDSEFTDSVIYVGLFVTKNTKNNPEMVILNNGSDLESKYFSYYQNAVKQRSKDKKSYAQYWEYFDVKLRGKSKIYFSGDGVYNQINPETFKTFEGQYLIDKYTFYFISNTRDIVDKQYHTSTVYTNTTAVMFGNPLFQTGSDSGTSVNSITPLDPLPGAELEVNLLNTFLTDAKWTTKEYIGKDASESVLKQIESPRILHIATHGFFMADEHNSKEEGLIGEESSKSTNPLLRSGLLFTGAAPLLATENVYKFNQSDGVLTAFEAMNLNLDHTEIVFLSACETGRGEVKSGEGVYGLQRSFIVAGAQNVVMTLFKVDDAVTQKLVTQFYTEWIKTGDKRNAFINAKKSILKEYNDPIYWGSFIMVGLD